MPIENELEYYELFTFKAVRMKPDKSALQEPVSIAHFSHDFNAVGDE